MADRAATIVASEVDLSVLGAFLIGSATTGEMCNAEGTSDVDILLVMSTDTTEVSCAQTKARLRAAFAAAQMPSAGLRCRVVAELAGFSRYLALQGYDSTFAVRLLDRGEVVSLPKPAVHPATLSESLCVLGESSWGELRCRALPSSSDGVTLYGAAKCVLAYTSLLLVMEGMFLPTHQARAARLALLQPQFADALDHALAAKVGTLDSPWPAAWAAVGEMRHAATRVVDRIGPTPAYGDAAQFWSDPAPGASMVSRQREARRACDELDRLLARPDLNLTVAPEDDALLPSACTASAARRVIHEYRIRWSSAARRDWGHIRL